MISNKKNKISEINVTPLVDVILVLLIIFMITAPMLNHGIKVNLPIASSGKISDNNKPIILHVNSKKEIFIDSSKIEFKTLKIRLEYIYKNKENKEIFIKADKDLKYGFIASVISETKNAGIKKIGLVTLPTENK